MFSKILNDSECFQKNVSDSECFQKFKIANVFF